MLFHTERFFIFFVVVFVVHWLLTRQRWRLTWILAASVPIESQFQSYIEELRQRFDVEFLDLRAAVDDGLFVDNHHVDMIHGRPQFTTLLARRLLELESSLDGGEPRSVLKDRRH